ncbi:hypothetical protein [Pontibacter sp. G13]|uniref:hypothetical protein n=1 Tax=Pontibacter sp. G13 TaxID=3074898 RepID=UPI00288B6BB2|nr:hypothetical protein [Pontibacter sp. G13]WNJ18770.1 hypothetical protein RJD25_28270 [Pontibacter sp. G13]
MRLPITFYLGMFLILAASTLVSCSQNPQDVDAVAVSISLDQERLIEPGKVLSSSTQSLNRYHSKLRDLETLSCAFDRETQKIQIGLSDPQTDARLVLHGLDARFLVPILPYHNEQSPDGFDLANLMLAEYARNGIGLSFQDLNDRFGYAGASDGLFDEQGEFIFGEDGQIAPNPAVKPKRVGITNNCLQPGLWELAAKDAVGEMYHGWFKLPQEFYLDIIKDVNGISISDEALNKVLEHGFGEGEVPLHLERLRTVNGSFEVGPVALNRSKELGSYSSQDSRRKVQRSFFRTMRDGAELPADILGDMQEGDQFELTAFVPPGVYDSSEPVKINFDPNWVEATCWNVLPKTSYGQNSEDYGQQGYLELHLESGDGLRKLVVGNVPISLLVPQEDYRIPAFGVGVFAPSELIERRYLRVEQGPPPHFAYLASKADGNWFMVNNHDVGYEQVILRPFQKSGQWFLRLTLVSYERIVDLLELEIQLSEELGNRLQKAAATYSPPIYEVYTDTNIL